MHGGSSIPLFSDVSLMVPEGKGRSAGFPTDGLQRGLLLYRNGIDLAQEAVGFGVPLAKIGWKTVFPGSAEFDIKRIKNDYVVSASFKNNLLEKFASPGKTSIDNPSLYRLQNFLAYLYRRFSPSRRLLTDISQGIRRAFHWTTVYEPMEKTIPILLRMEIPADSGKIRIGMDWEEKEDLGITEIVLMNEQGGDYFDILMDSTGRNLRGSAIGSWEEVDCQSAAFASMRHGLKFGLDRVPGAQLFAGREILRSRQAWSGFGYVIPPSAGTFDCELSIEDWA